MGITPGRPPGDDRDDVAGVGVAAPAWMELREAWLRT